MPRHILGTPNCEGANPDYFYPENPKHAKSDVIEGNIRNALSALMLCNSCPILNQCREYTFESLDLTAYGISAGLLPTEKRQAIGISMSDIFEPFWNTIRQRATASGITPPQIGSVKKPKRLYAMDDSEILSKRHAS